jgi:hypothetical protein
VPRESLQARDDRTGDDVPAVARLGVARVGVDLALLRHQRLQQRLEDLLALLLVQLVVLPQRLGSGGLHLALGVLQQLRERFDAVGVPRLPERLDDRRLQRQVRLVALVVDQADQRLGALGPHAAEDHGRGHVEPRVRDAGVELGGALDLEAALERLDDRRAVLRPEALLPLLVELVDDADRLLVLAALLLDVALERLDQLLDVLALVEDRPLVVVGVLGAQDRGGRRSVGYRRRGQEQRERGEGREHGGLQVGVRTDRIRQATREPER